ncbi:MULTISPECIES: DUF3953 domain-containing protein [Lysinibacillus]|uniref:DUF3953 domain-containing protein n=1 Tax=Lysinibacillus antri TaxID=2498145 RepID=A0A3S0PQD6_9BACI|nr:MULTISPECIES: DUF3953 domain-containing protein [Lysinibacillus]RUL54030.1 DUF3953 domain-containing protein [Lysinibacillus antri]TSI02582.1 DUF3953 domain-containing protein [Lysinibacillus sp. BW-2-10]
MEDKKLDSLMLLQLIFTVLAMAISSYCLVTENFSFLPLSFIFLSGIFIIIGLREYKRTQKLLSSIFNFAVALFLLYSAVLNILSN